MERKVEFDESDLVEVTPTPNLNLPDVKATRCLKPKDGSPYMVFFCEPSGKYEHGCRGCGSIDIIGNGTATKPRVVHDINIGLNRVDLIITVPRYRCKDCDSGFRHEFDSIPERSQHTYRLYEQIQRESFTRPFTDVAADFGYTEATVRNFFDEYAAELEVTRGPIIAPKVLGIDEKHIAHAMRGVFVNIENGRLLEMTEDNKEKDIVGTIEKMVDYDKNIKIVTTDMANGYRSHIHLCLPDAKIIVDKYHVYQDLYRRVTKTKGIIMEDISKQISAETDAAKAAHMRSVRDLVIHNAYLFKFGKKKLAEKTRRMAIMADVCKTFPELNHLRLIKEGFERIYEEGTSREVAESLYEEWTAFITPKGSRKVAAWESTYGVPARLYEELRSFYNTTQNWFTEIFNYFDTGCQFTNAASEGTNSMIQRINAQGSGYGFSRLRAKALFWSNAGGRISYSLKTKKTPIYGPKELVYSFMDVFSKSCISMPRDIIGYEHNSEIIKNPANPRTYISVLSYIDNESDFYEFEEE